MKLTIILTRESYDMLEEGGSDFISNDVFIGTRKAIKDMADMGDVNDNELALQVTVDKVYEPVVTTKLEELKDDS